MPKSLLTVSPKLKFWRRRLTKTGAKNSLKPWLEKQRFGQWLSKMSIVTLRHFAETHLKAAILELRGREQLLSVAGMASPQPKPSGRFDASALLTAKFCSLQLRANHVAKSFHHASFPKDINCSLLTKR
jgi:hypothetical protein